MKLAGRIQVEPLEDERWTNIERAVVTRAADAAAKGSVRPRWNLGLVVGAAFVVVVIVAGLIGAKVYGPSRHLVAEATPLAIDTTEKSSTIDIGDARILTSPATAVVVTRPAGGVLVTMARGRVELAVDKRGHRAPLVVRAGDTDVVVVGTRFSVDFGDGKHGVEVQVTEGVVKVVRASQETRVAANQSWSTETGLVATQVAVVGADRGAGTGPHATDSAGPTIDGAAAKGSGDYEIQMGDGPDVALHDRHPTTVPDVKAGSGSAAVAVKKPGGTDAPKGQPPTKIDADSADLKTLIKAQPLLPALEIGIKDPQKAADEYVKISATEKGERASQALYSRALVQYLRLGRAAEALSTLDLYFRRFADFTSRKEYAPALWLRVRILCLQKIDDQCRRAAYTYAHQTRDNAEVRHVAERISEQR